MSATPEYDCVIVGAGLAGAAAAAVLGNDGRRVALVDPRPIYQPAFKAEKIEPDQADTLRRLGLAAGVLPKAARIHTIEEAHGGRVLRSVPIEQYGIFYQDMVNAVRQQIPSAVSQRVARAMEGTLSAKHQAITLDSGETLTARLLVLAAGTGGQLHESLGVRRRVIRDSHSLCTGFDIARTDGRPFPFDSLTYWADSLDGSLDYVTLFLIPGRMRVNIFSYVDPKDPWVRRVATETRAEVDRLVPGVTRLIGDWKVTSKVESRPIDLYVAEAPRADGLVLIGDASQSVCPATGTGLSKVLTDVEVLCRTWLPQWLATPGMGAAKIASFYADTRKVECDGSSLAGAEYRRQFSTDRSLRWEIHRRKSYLRMAWTGFKEKRRRRA